MTEQIARLPLVLASASPRRSELLRAAGISHEVIASAVDESVYPGESADVYVLRLAEAKARAVLPGVGGRVVLGADTVVVVEGEILGKPRDAADATRMLRLLSGREHEVLTGVALISSSGAAPSYPRVSTNLARTLVEVSPLTDEAIAWYVASGEPMDKAGSYAIQGLASRFVIRIEGSYANVVGLPVALVYEMLETLSSSGR